MKESPFVVATCLALGTALISGVSNFIAKISVTVVKDPVLFTTLKNGVVAILLLGVILALRRWRELRTLSKSQWGKLIAIGVVGGSIPFALFFTGLSQTSAINGALIHKTLFLWVFAFGATILKERLTRWQLVGIAAVAVANVSIGGFTGFKYNTGELMILAATILWAIENIIAKVALKKISSLTVASARMIFGSVILLAFALTRGGSAAVAHLTATQWAWTFLSSALLLGYVITWYTALKRAPATYVAALLVPATLVTNVLSAIFITHAFPLVQLINALLISIGVACLVGCAKQNNALPNAHPAAASPSE